MKSRVVVFAYLLFVLIFSVAFIIDDGPLRDILSKLERFRTAYPQEKVHLHLDKPFYAIGDDIWFKAYVVDAEFHQLSGWSKILNIELIDGEDSIKQSLRLPLTTGVAWGDFRLPDTLEEGNYRIRAYTNYMRNFGDEYFFDTTIPVGNAISSKMTATVNYQYETQDAGQKVNATINYVDTNGRPLTDKKVNYDVQLDSTAIAKGKATTDSKGNIHISFLNNQPSMLKSGRLNTILEMGRQSNVRRSFPIKSTSNDTDVQFFPEGGNMVDGIRSRMAFKAVGADGLGRNITGYICDSKGEKVVEFKSGHAGMGSFSLQPPAEQTYTATIEFSDGSKKKIGLPKAQTEGFILGADNSDSTSLLVKISASPEMIDKGGQVTLVAQSNSVVKFVSKAKLDNAILNANIPKNRFPSGILQLTLFDQQNQPVAERLVFINHNDFLNVMVKGPKTAITREKVKFDLDVKDPSGNPVFGSFSVAVTDATKVSVDIKDEKTILTNLLLTSDIKGYVEQPNYYFIGVDERKTRSLDDLMLTQGWRRFSWKNILSDHFPPLTYKAEDGIIISGRITQNKKPVAAGKVTLLSSQGTFFAIDTLSDADGRFVFKNLFFSDSTRFVVQARTAKEKKSVDIELDYIPPQLIAKNKNLAEVEVNVNKKLKDYLKNSRNQFEELRRYGMLDKTIMLSEVNVVARKERTVEGSSNLAGRADVVITSDQLESCVSLDQCLQGKVAGLVIQDSMAFLTRSMYSSLSSRTPMTLIVDGVRMEPDYLSMINPQDVEAIEVLKGGTAAIYGMLGGGGVLVITTKGLKSITNYNDYSEGIITTIPKGYHKVREFYMPHYNDLATDTQMADLRATIFWKPNLIVKDGKTSFDYFNSDGKGIYKVTIEGIDANGELARYVYNYTVK